jgi:hypothetical protein
MKFPFWNIKYIRPISGKRLKTCKQSRSKILNFNNMKTKIPQFILPMLVIVFAITTAFNTNASTSSKKATALVTGYIQHIGAEEPCEASSDCDTSGATFCRVGQVATNPRLYDKNANDQCVIPLYKPAQ